MSNQSLREAAQQALEALKIYVSTYNDYWERGMEILEPIGEDAISRLEAALAQPEVKAQPVATQRDRLLAALERSAKAESMLRSLVDECDNDSVEGWEDRMRAIIECANRLLSSTSQPPAELCNIDEFSSRICERGVQSCTIVHAEFYEQGAELSDEQKKALIRAAGGIVHSDGNIFFTNFAQFLTAADRAARGGAA